MHRYFGSFGQLYIQGNCTFSYLQGTRLPAKSLEYDFICEFLCIYKVACRWIIVGKMKMNNTFFSFLSFCKFSIILCVSIPLVYMVYANFLFFLQIMADKNLEDNDIEPAPKLIEVVFQNCRGQVDHWVEPYLRITLDRLRRTEKSRLKCLLVQVVRCQDLVVFFCKMMSCFICLCLVNIMHSMFLDYAPR